LGQSDQAERDIATIQSYIERWVTVSQDIAKTKANWQFEKDVLLQTKSALEAEVQQVQAQIEEATKEEQTADEASQELAQEQVELTKAAETVTAVISQLEDRLVGLISKFPPSLQKDLGPDLEILNNKKKREEAGIATRVTTVTNILQAAEKANSEILVMNEERDVDGKTQSVRTVYFGLAIAYSSTEDETVGWIGTPGPSGWVFEQRSEEARAIARIVAIANDEADVGFVPVTAKIVD
jgi:chromosome segregation ATPase